MISDCLGALPKQKAAIWFADESNCWNFKLDGDQKMIFARDLFYKLFFFYSPFIFYLKIKSLF